jgi:hypothetical protein
MNLFVRRRSSRFSRALTLACLLAAGGIDAQRSLALPVDLATAQAAATDMIPVFYAGPWQYCTNFTYYDLDGCTTAYAIVFRRSLTGATQAASLEQMVETGAKEMEDLEARYKLVAVSTNVAGEQKRRELSSIEEQIIRIQMQEAGNNSFAAFFTNADDDLPVVRKCHLGLPASFVKQKRAKEWLANVHPDGRYRLGRFLYVGPFDEAYELVPAQPGGNEAPAVLDMRTHTIETAQRLREKHQELEVQRKTNDDAKVVDENRKVWQRYRRGRR